MPLAEHFVRTSRVRRKHMRGEEGGGREGGRGCTDSIGNMGDELACRDVPSFDRIPKGGETRRLKQGE